MLSDDMANEKTAMLNPCDAETGILQENYFSDIDTDCLSYVFPLVSVHLKVTTHNIMKGCQLLISL